MSRIGKLPINIPSGVEVSVQDNIVNVSGPKGKLEKHFSNNLFSQTRLEGGHLGSFDEHSLRNFVNIVKQFEIMEKSCEH